MKIYYVLSCRGFEHMKKSHTGEAAFAKVQFELYIVHDAQMTTNNKVLK